MWQHITSHRYSFYNQAKNIIIEHTLQLFYKKITFYL